MSRIDPNNKEKCKRDARNFSYLALGFTALATLEITGDWRAAILVTLATGGFFGWANNQLAQFKTNRN